MTTLLGVSSGLVPSSRLVRTAPVSNQVAWSRLTPSEDLVTLGKTQQHSNALFGTSHIQSLRFGESQTLKGKNIVYISGQIQAEPLVPFTGGLAIVTDEIPKALNKHHGANMVVMGVGFPWLLAPHGKKDEGWKPTGVKFDVSLPWVDPKTNQMIESGTQDPITKKMHYQLSQEVMPSHKASFELYEKRNEKLNTTFYVVKSEDPLMIGMDGKPKTMADMPNLSNAYGKGLDATEVKIWSLMSRAMAHAITKLDPTQYQPKSGEHITQFPHKIDAVITNDWHTGTVKPWLEKDVPAMKHTPNVFIVHNHFDKPYTNPALAEEVNFKQTPEGQKTLFWASQTGLAAGSISPLETGIKTADAIMINDNYYKELTDTPYLGQRNQDYIKRALTQHKDSHFDIHHGYESKYDPDAPELKAIGGKPFSITEADKATASPEGSAWRRFKAENKKVLQQFAGLKEDPDAVVFHSAARWDRHQKMVDLLMENIPKFLTNNPKAQVILNNNPMPHDARSFQFLNKMHREFRDRFYTPESFNPKLQSLGEAGSDFSINISQYEPMGTAHLASKRAGTIPIINYVGGLASSVSDPSKGKGIKDYGQTGVLMDPVILPHEIQLVIAKLGDTMTTPAFQQTIQGWRKSDKPEEQGLAKAYDRAVGAFDKALQEAMKIAQAPERKDAIRDEAVRYVTTEHDWKKIVEKYPEPIGKAIEVAKKAAQHDVKAQIDTAY
ncbi:MAG: glycogen/starch synthase [Vampirovibrionales bacterium]